MKKNIKTIAIAVAVLITVGAGTAVFAQNMVPNAPNAAPWGQSITVEGTLQLQNGSIVLVSGETTWFVPMLSRYVGFIDGLKEGSSVSVQGYAGRYNMLMPASMTINGKTYELFDFSDTAWGGPGMMGGGYCGNGYRYNGNNGNTWGGHHGGGYGRHDGGRRSGMMGGRW
ncbi:MAG: hypothetical protein LBU99_05070 [Spirochaetaceae bacterium]|jgi:hypothetical protein|nr:hypothetical protein [Spirochaetaceae bacterium]